MMDKTDFSDPKVFPYWANLAQTDPTAFEREREELIEGQIAGASARKQVIGRELQSRIDAARTDDPRESCVRLSLMMF